MSRAHEAAENCEEVVMRVRFTLLVVVALILPTIMSVGPARADDVVAVTGGAISGVDVDGITQFLGVPFAQASRFAAPRPATEWTGVRQAAVHGEQCPQTFPGPVRIDVPSGLIGPSPLTFSENCLTVDLYVPSNAAGRSLPVMVYLYGGAFVLGSNLQYDSPAEMVRNGDVIVAVPNYRVGPFGFLALPETEQESGGATGNWGIQDQQYALRWVRENIGAFGGDADNVTLFGESAGAMSVCTHFASPGSVGLFDKAIVQSGPCVGSPLVPPTKNVAFDRGADYATEMGCADPATRLDCLRALPANRLLDSETTRFDNPLATWTPVVDDVVLTSTPEEAFRNGAAADIPSMIGSNSEEGATFLVLFDYLAGTIPTERSVEATIRRVYPDRADDILAAYPLTAYPTPAEALSAVWTDSLFACPAYDTVSAAVSGGATVWQYRFTDAPVTPSGPVLGGAFHAAEIPYLFSRLGGVPVPLTGPAAEFAEQLREQWTTFAHSGSPEGAGLPSWRPWSTEDRPALNMNRSGDETRIDFHDVHRCSFW